MAEPLGDDNRENTDGKQQDNGDGGDAAEAIKAAHAVAAEASEAAESTEATEAAETAEAKQATDPSEGAGVVEAAESPATLEVGETPELPEALKATEAVAQTSEEVRTLEHVQHVDNVEGEQAGEKPCPAEQVQDAPDEDRRVDGVPYVVEQPATSCAEENVPDETAPDDDLRSQGSQHSTMSQASRHLQGLRVVLGRLGSNEQLASINTKLSEVRKVAGEATSRTKEVLGPVASSASQAIVAAAKKAPQNKDEWQESASRITDGIRNVAADVVARASGLPLGNWEPRPGPDEPSSQFALALSNIILELVMAAAPEYGAAQRRHALGVLIDGVASARHLADTVGKLLDFWYMLRCSALEGWDESHQEEWLTVAIVVQWGDALKPSHVLARAACGLLLELSANIRCMAPWWDLVQSESWSQCVRDLACMVDEMPLPWKWAFPHLALVRQDVSMPKSASKQDSPQSFTLVAGSSGSNITGSSIISGSSRGSSFSNVSKRDVYVRGLELAEAVALNGTHRLLAPRMQLMTERTLQKTPRELMESVLANPPEAPKSCRLEANRFFAQKTKPIHLSNQSGKTLKVCLFNEDDAVMAVPVGGVGGPCLLLLEPGMGAQLRPPGTASTFRMKVMNPGFIDKPLFLGAISRGQSMLLQGQSCVVKKQ